jgi:hypothetical protein
MGESVVPRQPKRAVGRLRLLVTALVAATVSVVGAVGTASAAPSGPRTGVLEICKVGSHMAGTFGFRVQGVSQTIEVEVGTCSFPITLPAGPVTVTEIARQGFSVQSITADDDRLVSSDLGRGTATVRIDPGDESNQTIVWFTNKATPKGYLEVCKKADRDDDLEGDFNFTVRQAGRPTEMVTVPVNQCSDALQLFVGTATITEVERTDSELVGVTASPGHLVNADVGRRTATVKIDPGDQRTQVFVTFINKTATPPPPPTGKVKVCKRAGTGVAPGTPFNFTLGTEGRSLRVRAGSCSQPQNVPVGDLTVTEKATDGLQVSNIRVAPTTAGRTISLMEGSATVRITRGRLTEVEFTNRTAPPGTIKVCKVAGNGVVRRTPFRFTVGTTPVTVLAGYCSLPLTVPADELTITESPTSGMRVTDISVVGAGELVDRNLAEGRVTVDVASSLVTEVVFTNAKPSRPVVGCVKPWKHYWKDRRVVEDLVPRGGLTVGGNELSAAQTHGMLRMAERSGNFRFELQGELIAALLNQLAGASTPTEVQAAIDAAELLTSQGGGSYHHGSGSMNTGKMSWWTPVSFKGKTYKAHQLADTLGHYNEGSSHGGPRWCHKQGWDEKDNPWDDGDGPRGGKDHPWGDKPHKDKKDRKKQYGNRWCWAI